MKVSVIVGGKWYAPELAEQLHQRGMLDRLFTSHPAWAFKSPGIPRKKVVHFPLAEGLAQGTSRLFGPGRGDLLKAELIDRFAAGRLGSCEALIAFASFGRFSLSKYQRQSHCVLERACPHILDQMELLNEEAALQGLPPIAQDERITQRMLAEYDLAQRIHVPSAYSRESFLRRGFAPQKIRVIALGGRVVPLKDPFNRQPQAIFRLLFVGGQFLRKGLIYLLKAWEELKLQRAELLLRASDGLDLPQVKKILNSNPSIRVVAHLSDLQGLYAQASAFCLPSVDDGFGMVVIEAMSHGLPVIVTRNVGAADCVREGIDGFVLPIRSVPALKEKIARLYEDRMLCLQMGESAWQQSQRYTWDAYGERVAESLNSLRSGAV